MTARVQAGMVGQELERQVGSECKFVNSHLLLCVNDDLLAGDLLFGAMAIFNTFPAVVSLSCSYDAAF